MFELFPKLWSIVYEAAPIDQVSVAIALLLSLLPWLWGLFKTRSARQQLTNANERIKILEQNRDDAIRAQKAAEAERNALSPDHWLRVADKEQVQGNEEKAMAVLAEGFAGVRTGMAHTALALAGDHLGQVIGPDRAFHLAEGERFARIATLLDPDDRDAAALAEEAAMERIDDGEDTNIPELRASYLPSDPNEATQLIDELCRNANRKLTAGHYHHGHQLVRRALLVSQRAGLYDQEAGCVARFWVAQMLLFKGDPRVAADIITALLPVQENLLGAEHIGVLVTRSLEVAILENLGECQAALEKVKALLPVQEHALGAEHPQVFSTRYAEASILRKLGKCQAAYDKVRALLPIRERVLGAGHPEVLKTRSLEAAILVSIGKYQVAFEKVAALLPVEERVWGAEHPAAFDTRYLEASILEGLGEYQVALEKVTALLPIEERVLGAEHLFVLKTRALRDRILANIAQGGAPATPAD